MENITEHTTYFSDFLNLKILILDNCNIANFNGEFLTQIKTLEHLVLIKCNENVLKVFKSHPSLKMITIRNDNWTWKGFCHETFNKFVESCPNLITIEMIGCGTGSYFDYDEFPYKIKVLITTMITFHWYVGIKTARLNFLESQLGYLKELTIHELPNDFDGGKVLKFIIEKMRLEKFYYGNIPLILNGEKQNVKEFAASEIQIQSLFEMFRQFESEI